MYTITRTCAHNVNDTTKGVDDLEPSSTGAGCLIVVDDPGTYSTSGGISPMVLIPGISSSVAGGFTGVDDPRA